MSAMLIRARAVLSRRHRFDGGDSVRIDGDRIVECGTGLSPHGGERVVDLGEACLLPGWINAHAHLELSRLQDRLPRGSGFVPWVRELVAIRRAEGVELLEQGIDAGIRQSIRAGTTTLAEVTTSGLTAARVAASGTTTFLFEEAIAFDPARSAETMTAIRARVEAIDTGEPMRRRAVAPHAPYTVSRELLGELADYAVESKIPISIHASETPEEIRMFSSGDGPLFDFLAGLGEVDETWPVPRLSPIAYLDSIGFLAARPLLVHCNYLGEADVECIRRSGAPVVFCPQSHRFFGHREHPFERLRAAGVPVALGTDSLASNDSLSMLDEVRELCRQFPATEPSSLLEAAFAGGAHALGVAGEVGAIAPGMRADLVAYVIDEIGDDPDQRIDVLLADGGLPDLVVAHGVVLHES